MRYDIILVLYNSAKWLPGCIKALANVEYNTKEIHIVLVDNGSTDSSVELARKLGEQYSVFGEYTIIKNNKNKGFGDACNVGAKKANAPYIFFLNIDTEVEPDVFVALDSAIEEYPEAGGFECRQLPWEVGHHVDPVTLETPWASGAALVVKREIFTQTKGFDEHIFMYCEDVDFSWRIRATGHPIFYAPSAVVNHFVLDRENESASELREYAGTQEGKLLLAYKYGTFGEICTANKIYLKELKSPRHFDNVRKVLLKNYLKHFGKLWSFAFWRFGNKDAFQNAPAVLNQAEFAPERGREILRKRITNGPKISVVVRTCGNPSRLRFTLLSLVHQTYNNFEVVIVEDGPPVSQEMVEREFAQRLNIQYIANGVNVGRGKNGNIGLAAGTGEYLNFLDDDDYFYPDHLELMAQKAMQNPDADLILGCAMVMKIDLVDEKDYHYEIKEIYSMLFSRIDIFTMSQSCQIPIQSAMFKKSLFLEYGGLREDIEGNEDTAMWLRFLPVAKRIDPKHVDIHRATSIFLLPANQEEAERRNKKYRVYNDDLYNDEDIKFTVTLKEMRQYFDDTIADMQHLQNVGKMDEYLKQQANRDKNNTKFEEQTK